MNLPEPLGPEELYRATDLTALGFETTADLEELAGPLGQPRALEAMRFGSGIEQTGYNIFAMGPAGVGKRSLLKQHFNAQAASEPAPSDWCYVFNFAEPHKPNAIQLPPGKGFEFEENMGRFVEELHSAVAAAFESDEYRSRRQIIEHEFQENQEQALETVQKQAEEKGFSLIRTPGGLVFAPVRDGEALSREEYQELSEEERKSLENEIENLQESLREILQKAPRLQREVHERLRELHRELIAYAVGGLIDELKEKYADFPQILEYLAAVQEDVAENGQAFLASEEGHSEDGNQSMMEALMARAGAGSQAAVLRRYKVNLLVNNKETSGAPVIYEDNPTYQNLIGRVEHMAQLGALLTDFTLIKPGALHRANGGYLILDARKLLQQPYAYDVLKRALQSQQVRIESVGQMLSLMSTVTLEPEAIPLDVKVGLFGDRLLYYLLAEHDPDFEELFRVQADFEELMDRSGQNQVAYARMIATLARDNELKPFDRGAVARVIEHSARAVSDSEKLSTQLRQIVELLQEANYWAGEQGNGVVTRADVQRAIDAKIFRADRLRERTQETILRETFLIDTTGEVVGQVNGLSVIQLGDFAFGRPSRITARVRMGKGEVIDIERQVELGGPIHSKGVLILSGFLGDRYARDHPLSLTASLVFEQSYGGVDGDSASSAELYALLSAIAEVPVRQGLAVTGAINQRGQVQAIGGVNEKIEGFFDICQARGLTGEQGVLVPVANVKHLMLRQDVVAAVAAGQFAVYPITHVDQGIELLTGLPAGEPNSEGGYPAETINGKVQRRLAGLAEKQRLHNAPPQKTPEPEAQPEARET